MGGLSRGHGWNCTTGKRARSTFPPHRPPALQGAARQRRKKCTSATPHASSPTPPLTSPHTLPSRPRPPPPTCHPPPPTGPPPPPPCLPSFAPPCATRPYHRRSLRGAVTCAPLPTQPPPPVPPPRRRLAPGRRRCGSRQAPPAQGGSAQTCTLRWPGGQCRRRNLSTPTVGKGKGGDGEGGGRRGVTVKGASPGAESGQKSHQGKRKRRGRITHG